MNRSSSNLIISKAIDGFVKFKMAEGLSPRSVNSYEFLLNQWLKHIGDKPALEISSQDITAYLAWMRTDYQPRRFTGQTNPLSPKTIRNTWITLMSFFGWLNREFKIPHPVQGNSAPRYQKAQPQPFTREEVELLLKACLYSRDAETKIRHSFSMRRGGKNGANFCDFHKILLDGCEWLPGEAETTVAASTWVAGLQVDSATVAAVALAIMTTTDPNSALCPIARSARKSRGLRG